MLRSAELQRRIGEAAQAGTPRKSCDIARESAQHWLLRCGTTLFTVPRAAHINARTAEAVQVLLERELGEQWWG